MAYLNWKDSKVFIGTRPHSRFQTVLTLKLRSEDRIALLSSLEDVYYRDEGELRLDLPSNWVVFWKKREQGSRTLLAHPQKEEWVATLALEFDLADRMMSKLKELGNQGSLLLSELGPLDSISNFEIELLQDESPR